MDDKEKKVVAIGQEVFFALLRLPKDLQETFLLQKGQVSRIENSITAEGQKVSIYLDGRNGDKSLENIVFSLADARKALHDALGKWLEKADAYISELEADVIQPRARDNRGVGFEAEARRIMEREIGIA